jgi:hypothetical protein
MEENKLYFLTVYICEYKKADGISICYNIFLKCIYRVSR